MRTGDLVSAAVLAGLGGYIILQARGWEYVGPDGPGPGFFPLWYGICMVVFALVLIATSLKGTARAADGRTEWRQVGRALLAWSGLALCVSLFKLLGFLLAFGLFTFFLVSVMYRRPFLTALVVSIAMPAGFYLLFPVALSVALPVGKLGF